MVSIFGLSPNMTSLVILLGLILIVFLFDRKKFRREGIMFLRRTERGLEFIDSFAKKHPTALHIFGNLGIIFSFGAAASLYLSKDDKNGVFGKASKALVSFIILFLLAFYWLMPANENNPNSSYIYAFVIAAFGASGMIISQLFEGFLSIISRTTTQAPLQFVLPIEAPGAPVVSVPIDFWLISIFVILVVHEFAHAFVARAEKIRVKSLGYGFMAAIPLGFAELDDEQLKTTESLKKSRIYSAGSFSNTITAIAAVLLVLAFGIAASAIYYPSGVHYAETLQDTPAYNLLPKEGIITEINGKSILSVPDISKALENISAGGKITLLIGGKNYELKTIENPGNKSRPFIGVSKLENAVSPKKQYEAYFGGSAFKAIMYLVALLKWIFLLNLGVGLANLLPLKPLDGGFILEEILKSFFPKSWGAIYYLIASSTLGLILLNLFGVYIIGTIEKII